MRPLLLLPLLALWALVGTLAACRPNEDLFPIPEAKPGWNITLSADTILLDTLPSLYLSSTYSLRIYNPGYSPLTLKHIKLLGGVARGYQINLNGQSGQQFEQVTLPERDSIQVFIRAFFAEGESDAPTQVIDTLRLEETSGHIYDIPIIAVRQNVEHIDALRIDRDTEISRQRPLLIRDSLIVSTTATLTLLPPTQLWMAASAYIRIEGRLVARGTAKQPIRLESIRRDTFLPQVSYSRVPGQWGGVIIGSRGSVELDHLHLCNSKWGLYFVPRAEGAPSQALSMAHTRLHNISGTGLRATAGSYIITDSEISNTLASALDLSGGIYTLERSSVLSFYPWPGLRSGAAITYTNALHGAHEANPSSRLNINYSVVDGRNAVIQRPQGLQSGGELSLQLQQPIEAQQVRLYRSYLRSIDYSTERGVRVEDIDWATREQLADSLYQRMGWDEAQKRRDYSFDFRPRTQAPFVRRLGEGAGYTDLNGRPRTTPLTYGAHEPSESTPTPSPPLP